MRTIVRPLVLVAFASLAGCGTEPPDGGETDPPSVSTPLAQFDKVDLLLVVDNSISMAEKQGVLAKSVERLLAGLVNPACVDAAGEVIEQPATPEAACPSGSHRRAAPVRDLHVGVISSNLGALGGDGCSSATMEEPDQAHLRTIGQQGAVTTYQDLGFLAWDPQGQLSPAGESSFETLVASTVEIVAGMGERGCGFEMPLEAMTRFLVDPSPYQSLAIGQDGVAQPTGVDDLLLAQRAAFLRPDSIVGVVLLSDENDCSLIPEQAHYLLGADPFFRATSACEADPNDACCTSCGLPTPDGCAPDPSCSNLMHDAASDAMNLKCFDQKRRYGVDFHYPMARYSNALSSEQIDPLLVDFAPSKSSIANPLFVGDRQPEHVIFTTITGVPWQDLATDPANGASQLKSSAQMEADGTWAWLLGQDGAPPSDPFMRESIAQRTGASPATGESVSGPNGINGGDRSIAGHDDLQYACSFPLETPIDGGLDCSACVDESCDNPLCEGTTQVGGKAYPGLRQLELARSLGDRAVSGSICPPIADRVAENRSAEAKAGLVYTLPLEQLVLRVSELLPDAE